VDLENESIVEKNQKNKQQDADEEVEGAQHPLMINQYPLCEQHSLLLMFAEEGLPQVLSDELLLLLFSIFKMTGNEQLRLGYNSMGADCITNNLHFHLASLDQLFDETSFEVFPIEKTQKKLFFKSQLKHKKTEELNMYNVGFRMGELPLWPVRTLIVSPDVVTHTGE